ASPSWRAESQLAGGPDAGTVAPRSRSLWSPASRPSKSRTTCSPISLIPTRAPCKESHPTDAAWLTSGRQGNDAALSVMRVAGDKDPAVPAPGIGGDSPERTLRAAMASTHLRRHGKAQLLRHVRITAGPAGRNLPHHPRRRGFGTARAVGNPGRG